MCKRQFINVRMMYWLFQGTGSGPSPMAALMSVADNLTSPEPVPQPPNNPSPTSRSPPTTAANAQQRSASRGSQHSPNSSGNYSSICLVFSRRNPEDDESLRNFLICRRMYWLIDSLRD